MLGHGERSGRADGARVVAAGMPYGRYSWLVPATTRKRAELVLTVIRVTGLPLRQTRAWSPPGGHFDPWFPVSGSLPAANDAALHYRQSELTSYRAVVLGCAERRLKEVHDRARNAAGEPRIAAQSGIAACPSTV